MTIKYYTKQVYGNEYCYLLEAGDIDPQPAQSILNLIGQKTISRSQMKLFNNLGLTFERVFEPEK